MNVAKAVRQAMLKYTGDLETAPAAKLLTVVRLSLPKGTPLTTQSIHNVKTQVTLKYGKPFTREKLQKYEDASGMHWTQQRAEGINGPVNGTASPTETKELPAEERARTEITLSSMLKAKEFASSVGGYEAALNLLTTAKEYLK